MQRRKATRWRIQTPPKISKNFKFSNKTKMKMYLMLFIGPDNTFTAYTFLEST